MRIPAIEAKARNLLDTVGWCAPGDLSMEEIILSQGLFIKEQKMDGSEGRIVMNELFGIITVNNNIRQLSRKRFTLAHELGHYMLHKDLAKSFVDDNRTLNNWHNEGNIEYEANTFASELLMPSNLFSEQVKGKPFKLSLLQEVSAYFQSSLTASALKYIYLGDFPIMIIYCQNNRIKWKFQSEDFPLNWLPIKSQVPECTVAGDYFHGNGLEENPVEIEAIEWFAEDLNIEKHKHLKLWEQCFQVHDDSIICMLWTK